MLRSCQHQLVTRCIRVGSANVKCIRRHYATPIEDSWHTWPTHPNPTPYQIFNCQKGEPYSRKKYYELCMLYHPDRRPYSETGALGGTGPISENVRNDRFRLVVAANEILSDPARRRAYDRYGAGWNGHAGVRRRDAYRHSSAGANVGASGSNDPDPHRNATWEDWERYYAQQAGATPPNQQPVFTSNATFLSILLLCVSLGSLFSINHAQAQGEIYMADRNRLHERISKDLARRRKEAVELGDKDERVRNFLRNRNPLGRISDSELVQEKYRRLLPAMEDQRKQQMIDNSTDIGTRLIEGPVGGDHHGKSTNTTTGRVGLS